MATLDSSFAGVPWEIYFNEFYSIPQTPKWVDRHEVTDRGSVQISINGRPALQELTRKWRPVTLEFRASNLPPALMTEAMLLSFLTAVGGGIKTLRLESVNKQVVIDWRVSQPVSYVEVTPTGANDVYPNLSQPVAVGRLYEGVVHFIELLS